MALVLKYFDINNSTLNNENLKTAKKKYKYAKNVFAQGIMYTHYMYARKYWPYCSIRVCKPQQYVVTYNVCFILINV